MTFSTSTFQRDLHNIQKNPIIPTLLEVVCRTTGMGFAAVARVTEDRWIACSVRDEINFGLVPGGELPIETTICNEIRDSREPVVIEEVASDKDYCQHHTPKRYGFQSYISMPITLPSGAFFGTLCSIDPLPAKLKNVQVVGMFALFAQLIAFHLDAIDTIESTSQQFREISELLAVTKKENLRYEHITYHSLREPVRKLSLYSDKLLQEINEQQIEKAATSAQDIHRFSKALASMLSQLPAGH